MGGGAVSYDGNFNLTGLGGFWAIYNAANQVVSAQSGKGTAQFVYDGLERCLKRTVSWETTLIAYDGWQRVPAYNFLPDRMAWNSHNDSRSRLILRASFKIFGTDLIAARMVREARSQCRLKWHPWPHRGVAINVGSPAKIRVNYRTEKIID